ncbi:unnamed protein product, partial [Polarella glacialis]
GSSGDLSFGARRPGSAVIRPPGQRAPGRSPVQWALSEPLASEARGSIQDLGAREAFGGASSSQGPRQ